MRINVYVNWNDGEICSEKGKEEWIARQKDYLFQDAFDSDEEEELLWEALNERGINPNCGYTAIFAMTEEDKESIRKIVAEKCEEAARARFEEYFTSRELEV